MVAKMVVELDGWWTSQQQVLDTRANDGANKRRIIRYHDYYYNTNPTHGSHKHQISPSWDGNSPAKEFDDENDDWRGKLVTLIVNLKRKFRFRFRFVLFVWNDELQIDLKFISISYNFADCWWVYHYTELYWITGRANDSWLIDS